MPTTPLKRALIRQFGRPILTKSDAQDLETAIFESTGEMVSYNTIRRFFGLAQGGEPRTSVLNIYSRYLGFPSYMDFHRSIERHTFYNLWTQTWKIARVSPYYSISFMRPWRRLRMRSGFHGSNAMHGISMRIAMG
ncbi:MAG: hypothetical protein EBZ16_07090 [Flavobacteriia bacterium]|nr:hypothetical protein [Flavobacteriia bacterium]